MNTTPCLSIYDLYKSCSSQPYTVAIYNEDDDILIDTWSEKELKEKGYFSPGYSVKSWWMVDGKLRIWI